MTASWVPKLDEEKASRGSLYWRIAEALARDIHAGRLGTGDQLPTHRALAHALGVTVNTVTKAYAEAERSGLIVSRTGRGTFVRNFPEEVANGAGRPQELLNLSTNTAASKAFSPVFNRLMGALSRRGSLHGLMEHHPHPGLEHQRAAGARWMARRGIDAKSENVILCNGAQEGLLSTFAALTRPGDTVLTESLGYAGLRYIAEILHINFHGVEIDEQGIVPDSLEAACHKDRVAAVLVSPTNHNPTNAFSSLERRRSIIEVAARANLPMVEDDVYGHISGDEVPTMAALAPDRCIYICGTSKSIAAGIRLGYILAPEALAGRIVDSLNRFHWNSPTLMAEIVTLLIDRGYADEFVAWHGHEARIRQSLAREMLGIKKGKALRSYHLWVPLPETWSSTDFAAAAKSHGVLVAPAERFAVEGNAVPNAIRIALGSESDQGQLSKGLGIVAELFQNRLGELGAIDQLARRNPSASVSP